MSGQQSEPVYQRGWLPPRGVAMLRWAFATLFRILSRLEVRGLENFPASGGFIISTNHLSRLDAPLVFMLVKNRKLTAFAADTYRHRPFFHMIVQSIDVIWVHRGAIGPSTLKYAIQALRQGSVIGVAPEGTLSFVQCAPLGTSNATWNPVAPDGPLFLNASVPQ